MKMAKKLLAVVLAGVLALSVLTGCGNAVSTKTIADAMSDMGKAEGSEYKVDSNLNEKARLIAPLVASAIESGEVTLDLNEDEDEGPSLAEQVMTTMGEGYKDKFVFITATKTKGYNVTAQAYNLLENMDNVNDAVDMKDPADVYYVGMATFTAKGEGYRLAVITADAVEVNKPEKN